MKITQQKKKNELKVVISGRIDTLTAPDLEKEVQVDDVDKAIFDMADVDYISSAGLRVLLGFLKILDVNHGEMRVINLQPEVLKIFKEVGFDTIMKLD